MSRRSNKDLLQNHPASGWVTLPINLRASQYEALSRFADEMGMSTSRTARRILAEFLAVVENDQGGDGEAETSGAAAESCSAD